ncbi:MAG TPA: hypothetical protein VJP79_06035 [Nitrososphaera sp.]|nr:hypothetical protein [Nitrososphaera sp.]
MTKPRDPTTIIVRRSLSLSRTYVLLSIAIAANGIFFSSFGNMLARETPVVGDINSDIQTSVPLLSIPLMATAALTLSIPVSLLFVYDKNNGVLERFLSLGLTQADIYKRYLKASIRLALVFLPAAIAVYLTVGWLAGSNMAVLLLASAVIVVLGLSVVTLVSMSMMSFSSMQKERVGANQPVGIGIGGLVVIPYYVIPFGWPIPGAVRLELAIAVAIGAAALALLVLAGRLIKREKLLP